SRVDIYRRIFCVAVVGDHRDLHSFPTRRSSDLSLAVYLVHILVFVIMVTVGSSIGLLIAAVLVMPMVVGHVARTDYPQLERRGSQVFMSSLINSLKVGAIFIVGWVITLPFWLIPPVAVLLHIFWWAYAFTHMLRFDALVEHATLAERARVIAGTR